MFEVGIDTEWIAVALVSGTVFVFAIAATSSRCRRYLFQTLMLRRDDPSWKTVSNRIPIWQHVWRGVARHPLLGFGFGGFWYPARGTTVGRHLKWRKPVDDSYSLYLETVVNTGICGSMMLAACLTTAFATASQVETSNGGFLAAVVIFVTLQGIFESTLVLANFRAFSIWLLLSGLS